MQAVSAIRCAGREEQPGVGLAAVRCQGPGLILQRRHAPNHRPVNTQAPAGIVAVRHQFGLTMCSSTLRVQFGRLTCTDRENRPVRCQCGANLVLFLRSYSTGQARRRATTPPRQSGCKTPRQCGNLAKSLRRQNGRFYDAKKIRNMKSMCVGTWRTPPTNKLPETPSALGQPAILSAFARWNRGSPNNRLLCFLSLLFILPLGSSTMGGGP